MAKYDVDVDDVGGLIDETELINGENMRTMLVTSMRPMLSTAKFSVDVSDVDPYVPFCWPTSVAEL